VFACVTIAASDLPASAAFYTTVLPGDRPDFSVVAADGPDAVTRRLHLGFAAASREDVDAFWRAGVDAGHPSDGEPGPRPQYRHDYYGAFLLDPDGNSIEAVHHGAMRAPGLVDHVWIRVSDLAASRRFYESLAPRVGCRVGTDTPERVSFNAVEGSFSLVEGEPTANLRWAFAAADAATERDPDGNVVELTRRSA
jgi:catechol 2,3-dioxygenase-like lactoylglutathione lyase family enzyme